jgi:hypothetical protein
MGNKIDTYTDSKLKEYSKQQKQYQYEQENKSEILGKQLERKRLALQYVDLNIEKLRLEIAQRRILLRDLEEEAEFQKEEQEVVELGLYKQREILMDQPQDRQMIWGTIYRSGVTKVAMRFSTVYFFSYFGYFAVHRNPFSITKIREILYKTSVTRQSVVPFLRNIQTSKQKALDLVDVQIGAKAFAANMAFSSVILLLTVNYIKNNVTPDYLPLAFVVGGLLYYRLFRFTVFKGSLAYRRYVPYSFMAGGTLALLFEIRQRPSILPEYKEMGMLTMASWVAKFFGIDKKQKFMLEEHWKSYEARDYLSEDIQTETRLKAEELLNERILNRNN